MTVPPQFDMTGRVALVTGASRGIGRAIALGLGRAGAAVAVHCAGNVAAAQQAADKIDRSCVVQGDLSDERTPSQIVDQAAAALGPIDILVLNASIQIRQSLDQITLADARQQLQVNLLASLQLVQACLPGMVERRWGRILTIGSVQQQVPHPQMLVYAASKSAQLNICRNLARQVAASGVTVNNLAPGVIDTDRNSEALSTQANRQRVLERIPADSIGVADDCVGAALLMCSDAGRYITGADLLIDGGMAL